MASNKASFQSLAIEIFSGRLSALNYPLGDLPEQCIARGVPVVIVDRFEVVQVEEHESNEALVATSAHRVVFVDQEHTELRRG